MTRAQIERLYNIKMSAILNKKAQHDQEQDAADRAAWQKTQQDTAKANATLTLLGLYKDIKENYNLELARATYGDDPTEGGFYPKKFERKDPRSLGEVLTQPGETVKRLLPGGAYEQTEGYKEFQAKEAAKELEKARATVPIAEELEGDEPMPFEIPPETPEIPLAEELTVDEPMPFEDQYKDIVFEGAEPNYEELGRAIIKENDWLKKGKVDAYTDLSSEELVAIGRQYAPGLVDAEITARGDAGIPIVKDGRKITQTIHASPHMVDLSQKLQASPDSFISMTDRIDAKKFNQYGLTKTRAQELSNILEREGVIIPAGMTEEKTLELLSSFDKVPMGKSPVGALAKDQPEYRAFVDTLKSGSQNPDTFQSVVTDLTVNTDETIQSAIEGTYVPEVKDVSYERDLLKEAQFIDEEKAFLFDDPGMSTVETGAPGAEIIESAYMEELEEWQKDLGVGELGADVFTEEELKNLPASSQQAVLPTKAPARPGQYGLTPQQKAIQELERKTLPSGVSMQELEGKLPSEPVPSFREGTLPKTLTAEPTGLGRTRRLSGFDPEAEDFDPSQITPRLPESVGVVPELAGTEGAPITPDVEIPDAKPGFAQYAGKGFQALQTGKAFLDIGKTLTDKEVSDADKTLAGIQGTKILADLATKRAGQEAVSQIGSKAATQFVKGKGLKEGLKLTGKQAVGATLGGVLGAHQMVTEAGEAKEAWEEKDYDEAILHGIGAVSGGMQTAGASMMATGVGAPIGAVLYGIGTVGTTISNVGQLFEGLFGKDSPIQEVAPKKPKFSASQYLDSIRSGRSGMAYNY